MSVQPSSPVEALHAQFRDAGAFALVVSGPSGVGKTSICRAVLRRTPGVGSAVTTTTRAPRPGEKDGSDYHFVTEAQYNALVASGGFLERAEVHGHRYGCTAAALSTALGKAPVVLLEVDVQGARTWRRVLGLHAVSLFLLPPSVDELRTRLTNRRSEASGAIRLRIANALSEMGEAPDYDYVVMNRDLETAIGTVIHVLEAERVRTSRSGGLLRALGIPS